MKTLINAYEIGTGYQSINGHSWQTGVAADDGAVELIGPPTTVDFDDDDFVFQNDSSTGASEEGGVAGQVLSGTSTTIFIDGTSQATDTSGNVYTIATIEINTAGATGGNPNNVDGQWILIFDGPLPASGVLDFNEAIALPQNTILTFDNGSFESTSTLVCFVAGTMIKTQDGERAVEDLSVGDMIETIDHGLQPIRWIGCTKVHATGKLHPVRISAGALGQGLPKRDILVSRQHRMVVSSTIANRMFDGDVLIPAIKLVGLPGIFVDDSMTTLAYFHILFDRHELIFAEGAPTESLYTGEYALEAILPAARTEIFTLFPELEGGGHSPRPALPIPAGKLQKKLVARHAANKKPLIDLHMT